MGKVVGSHPKTSLRMPGNHAQCHDLGGLDQSGLQCEDPGEGDVPLSFSPCFFASLS